MHNPVMGVLRQPRAHAKGLFLMRLAAGAVFMYHGCPKLFGDTAMFVGFFDKIGIPAPHLMVPFVGFIEFFGGAMLILGLGTRLWGAALAFDMIVAILAAKGLSSWGKIELEVLLMAASFQALLVGAGAWSIDALLMKRASAAHDAALPVKKA